MEKMEIDRLINNCIDYFKSASYTQNRIDKYRSLWRRGILLYMRARSLTLYTPDVGKCYVSECVSNENLRHEDREKMRSIQVLDDYLDLGYIRKNTTVPVRHELDGPIGCEMRKLIHHLQSLRRNKTTIGDYELYLSRFLKYLNSEGVTGVDEISESHILRFVSTSENNKSNIVGALRVLFRFWFGNHITGTDKEQVLANYKWTRKERIPSFYTPEEVLRIESSIDRCGGTGKRNYAMMLLATRLGLRAADIASLKLSDMDWIKNGINIVQNKTKEPVRLPLLADVGNAIIDYLKHGRFNSASQSVFISSRAPYVDATKAMVCGALNDIISKAGVSIKFRHHGPHSMRHSLASALMQNGTPIPVISEALGHKSTVSTVTYLKIDIVSLLKCALPVSPVEENFYLQKGGAFYE